MVQLSVADAKKSLKVGKLEVGWSVCPQAVHDSSERLVTGVFNLDTSHGTANALTEANFAGCMEMKAIKQKAHKCLICPGKFVNSKHPTRCPKFPAFKNLS